MADLRVLVRRLIEVLAPPSDDSPEAVADAITSNKLQGAMCWRDPFPDGKCLSFQRYFEAVYGRQLDGSELKVGKEKKR